MQKGLQYNFGKMSHKLNLYLSTTVGGDQDLGSGSCQSRNNMSWVLKNDIIGYTGQCCSFLFSLLGDVVNFVSLC